MPAVRAPPRAGQQFRADVLGDLSTDPSNPPTTGSSDSLAETHVEVGFEVGFDLPIRRGERWLLGQARAAAKRAQDAARVASRQTADLGRSTRPPGQARQGAVTERRPRAVAPHAHAAGDNQTPPERRRPGPSRPPHRPDATAAVPPAGGPLTVRIGRPHASILHARMQRGTRAATLAVRSSSSRRQGGTIENYRVRLSISFKYDPKD
jgi:hypothetical protein